MAVVLGWLVFFPWLPRHKIIVSFSGNASHISDAVQPAFPPGGWPPRPQGSLGFKGGLGFLIPPTATRKFFIHFIFFASPFGRFVVSIRSATPAFWSAFIYATRLLLTSLPKKQTNKTKQNNTELDGETPEPKNTNTLTLHTATRSGVGGGGGVGLRLICSINSPPFCLRR